MINLRESYVAGLGVELATPEFALRLAADCAIIQRLLWRLRSDISVLVAK